VWWAYLLYSKNETAFKERIELESIRYSSLPHTQNYFQTSEYDIIHKKYVRQKWMILMEGSVFVSLLLLGLLQVRKTFAREMALAAQQRNFLLSITHELKSPISTVKLSVQTMQKRDLDAEQKSRVINNSLADIERLESLVNNILFAAKIENEKHEFTDSDVKASELVNEVADKLSNNKKNISIRKEIQPDITLRSDHLGFTSLVINLIENAIKYSDNDTSVLVALSETENDVQLKIADTGMGIPESERENIFDKFYRIGNEDTRKTKGTGLGLFIVKRFVEIYKGEISVTDNQPKGTVFTITLLKNPL
jgi:signal transduction histidine kinase